MIRATSRCSHAIRARHTLPVRSSPRGPRTPATTLENVEGDPE